MIYTFVFLVLTVVVIALYLLFAKWVVDFIGATNIFRRQRKGIRGKGADNKNCQQ